MSLPMAVRKNQSQTVVKEVKTDFTQELLQKGKETSLKNWTQPQIQHQQVRVYKPRSGLVSGWKITKRRHQG